MPHSRLQSLTLAVILALNSAAPTFGMPFDPRSLNPRTFAWSGATDAFFPSSSSFPRGPSWARPTALSSRSGLLRRGPTDVTAPTDSDHDSSTSFAPDTYIVVLRDNTTSQAFVPVFQQWLDQQQPGDGSKLGYVYDPRILNGFSSKLVGDTYRTVIQNPAVLAVYPDTVMSIIPIKEDSTSRPSKSKPKEKKKPANTSTPTPRTSAQVSPASSTGTTSPAASSAPASSHGGSVNVQIAPTWGLARISRRSPVSDAESSTDQYEYRYRDPSGGGVQVFVLDTGVKDTHQDFGGRAKLVQQFGGYPMQDGNGHGTHCSGTVAADTYGVAKMVSLKGVKVLGDNGFGASSDIIAGIEYVVSQYRLSGYQPTVASMSLGGPHNDAVDKAVGNAVMQGIHMAVAAGNTASDACTSSPAGSPLAVTVGATDIYDNEASYSNWGRCVDVLAPGTDIHSTWIDDDTSTKTLSGTSMATPHVAGLMAYYLSQRNMTTDEMGRLLRQTATQGALNIEDGSANLLAYNSVDQ